MKRFGENYWWRGAASGYYKYNCISLSLPSSGHNEHYFHWFYVVSSHWGCKSPLCSLEFFRATVKTIYCLETRKNDAVEFISNNKFSLLPLWSTGHLLLVWSPSLALKVADGLKMLQNAVFLSFCITFFIQTLLPLNQQTIFSLYYLSLLIECSHFVHVWILSAGLQQGILSPWKNIALGPLYDFKGAISKNFSLKVKNQLNFSTQGQEITVLSSFKRRLFIVLQRYPVNLAC